MRVYFGLLESERQKDEEGQGCGCELALDEESKMTLMHHIHKYGGGGGSADWYRRPTLPSAAHSTSRFLHKLQRQSGSIWSFYKGLIV